MVSGDGKDLAFPTMRLIWGGPKQDGAIVSMVTHKDRLFVASQSRVYEIVFDELDMPHVFPVKEIDNGKD